MMAENGVSAAIPLPVFDPTRTLDDLDRHIVACLQVNARAGWQQIARVVGASESTVSRRANRLIEDGVVRISAMLDPVRTGRGTAVLMQLTCDVGAATSVARTMAARPDVRFVTLLTGGYDVLLEVVVASRAHIADVVFDELGAVPGITATTTETVVRNFKASNDWSRGGFDAGICDLEAPVSHETGPVQLSPDDLRLVDVLTRDGRMSVAELASTLSLGESTIRRRLDHLTRTGVLWFATYADPQAMGFQTEMFVWLEVDLARLESVAAALVDLPEVRYVSSTAGRRDLVCELVLRDLDDLYRFSTEVLGALAGIRRVEMGQELQILKRGFLISPQVAPWSSGRRAG